MKRVLVCVLFFLVLIPAAWVLIRQFEGTAPAVDIGLPSKYLNKSYELTLDISDHQTGLRHIRVSIVQKDKEKVLLEKAYDSGAGFGVLPGGGTSSDHFIIPVQTFKYGMSDGDAQIRIEVADRSWRGLNRGNIVLVEEKVVIDTTPPEIKVLSRRHNIERGGSALLIYQLFEDEIQSGVKVGENFFPGHSGMFDNPQIHAAFFALDHTQGPGTSIHVQATDPAGNQIQRGFHTYIRDRRFKTDVLNIPQGFLDRKINGFDVRQKESEFKESKNPLLGKYIYINNTVREENVARVLSIPSKTEARKLWEGRFLRMKGSQRKAGFGDKRIYKFKGKEIDRAVHLGIDLASTAGAKIEAANGGKVIFTGDIGIFGKTIIIDHGFGLCSLYSHLSRISVEKDESVTRGKMIGASGQTGLAGGDHLHFSMIVHNVFVNPVEWWDPAWIKNNITSKIAAAASAVKE